MKKVKQGIELNYATVTALPMPEVHEEPHNPDDND
jgi:hypothetical protein